jgi:hypothetical protein
MLQPYPSSEGRIWQPRTEAELHDIAITEYENSHNLTLEELVEDLPGYWVHKSMNWPALTEAYIRAVAGSAHLNDSLKEKLINIPQIPPDLLEEWFPQIPSWQQSTIFWHSNANLSTLMRALPDEEYHSAGRSGWAFRHESAIAESAIIDQRIPLSSRLEALKWCREPTYMQGRLITEDYQALLASAKPFNALGYSEDDGIQLLLNNVSLETAAETIGLPLDWILTLEKNSEQIVGQQHDSR